MSTTMTVCSYRYNSKELVSLKELLLFFNPSDFMLTEQYNKIIQNFVCLVFT